MAFLSVLRGGGILVHILALHLEVIMGFTKCPECGGQVSDKGNSCPHCGYDLMDSAKTIAIIIGIILSVITVSLVLYFYK
jgi:uncharacterized protein (UPF0212 family)